MPVRVNLGGVDGRDTSASALVVVDWNLYRGGGDTARVREFINREAQAKEARTEAARSLENNVRRTWAQMVSAGEQAREFSAQADANTEVVKAYMDQFDLTVVHCLMCWTRRMNYLFHALIRLTPSFLKCLQFTA